MYQAFHKTVQIGLHQRVASVTAQAAGHPPRKLSRQEVEKALADLVQLEAMSLQQQEAFAAAEAALAQDASAKILLHRIVKHFQRLFDVDSLSGMFPKMNVRGLFLLFFSLRLSPAAVLSI